MWLCRSPRMSSRLDEARQPGAAVESRGLELAAILAQLRLDVGEAEQLVQLRLARAGARPADGVVEQPVLGDVQPPAHRRFAQRRIVRARAREVLQQVAELRGLGDSQIHRHARVGARPRARSAGRADALDLLELGEALRQRRRARRDGDQVEILDAVGLATRRPGQLHLGARAPPRGQVGDECFTGLDRRGQQHSRSCAFASPLLQRRQHAGLELRAEPAHGAQALVQRRLAQLLERVDAELRVQQARALGSQTRQPCDRDQAGGKLGTQRLGRWDRARVEQREDLLLQRVADGRQLGRTARARQRRHRHGCLAHRLGGCAVGQHAMHDRPVELVQVTQLLQGVRDSGVGQLRAGPRASGYGHG